MPCFNFIVAICFNIVSILWGGMTLVAAWGEGDKTPLEGGGKKKRAEGPLRDAVGSLSLV